MTIHIATFVITRYLIVIVNVNIVVNGINVNVHCLMQQLVDNICKKLSNSRKIYLYLI
jgi:hypothetical protein